MRREDILSSPHDNNRAWKWPKRILSGLLALIVFLSGVGLIDQALFKAHSQRYSAPGNLIDVARHRMHINCSGKGTPTVVLESGFGGYSLDWVLVQPQVSQFTKVCSYDRAGLGWSDPVPGPRTSSEIADELYALLVASNIPGPYVLVGHSLGGYHIRVFTSKHREDVIGIVLVDSSHEDQENRISPEFKKVERQQANLIRASSLTIWSGLPRLLGLCGDVGPDPPPQRRAVAAMMAARDCRAEFFRTLESEMAGEDASARQVIHSGLLGDIPLTVISHDPDAGVARDLPSRLRQEIEPLWTQMQLELTQLSSNSTHIIAKGSHHYIQIERPDVVIDGIHDIIEKIRHPLFRR